MHAFTYAYVLCIYGLHLRITLREKQLGGKKGEERRGGGVEDVNVWQKRADERNKEGASRSRRREVKRVWGEEESRLERKEEQTIPRIPSTSLAKRERREERRGCSERWRASTEYQRENKC